MSNCKPGDLAIVAEAVVPSNLGRIVRVLRPYSQSEFPRYGGEDDLPSWAVESVGSMLAESHSGIITGYTMVRPFYDHCLRPVSGLPDTEQTDEREPIKEVA